MVADETVVFMELRDADLIRSPLPEKVYASLFVSEREYLAVSNMADAPYTLTLRDRWQDRVSGETGDTFTIPARRMLFLLRTETEN